MKTRKVKYSGTRTRVGNSKYMRLMATCSPAFGILMMMRHTRSSNSRNECSSNSFNRSVVGRSHSFDSFHWQSGETFGRAMSNGRTFVRSNPLKPKIVTRGGTRGRAVKNAERERLHFRRFNRHSDVFVGSGSFVIAQRRGWL